MTVAHEFINPVKPSRVIILGAHGFIGRHLLEACKAAEIEAVGHSTRDMDLTAPDAARILAGRLRAKDALVFLSAITPDKGRDPSALIRNMIIGRSVCEAAKLVELSHLVYASSDAVYPFGDKAITEDTPAVPHDLYGAMHRAREIMIATETKVPTTVLRFTGVYGHGDTHNAYGPNRFLRQALKDTYIQLVGNGEEMRDHLYIDDAVKVILSVIGHRSTGLLNVVTGTSDPFRRVAEMIAECVRKTSLIPSIRHNQITHRVFNNSALRRAFPDMQFTRLADGLAAMLAKRDGVKRAA